jgi:hypothetical protein
MLHEVLESPRKIFKNNLKKPLVVTIINKIFEYNDKQVN